QPPPARRFAHRSAHHLAFPAQGFHHIHPAEFGDSHEVFIKLDPVIGDIETGLATLSAFKFRIAYGLAFLYATEEVGEGFPELNNRPPAPVFRDSKDKGETARA